MEILLRDFRKSDFNTLWEIDQQCFPPQVAYSRQELSSYIQRRGTTTLVAEFNASMKPSADDLISPAGIVGYIVAEASRRGSGHIITLDVTPLLRRAGVGSMLLNAAEARLMEAKCFTIRLEAAVDNLPAVTFYRHHGYAITNTIKEYYGNGSDAFSMEKKL